VLAPRVTSSHRNDSGDPATTLTQGETPDESVSQWSATLNDLAAWCDFADTVFRAAEVAAEDSLDDAQDH